jgi:hypothetical protein
VDAGSNMVALCLTLGGRRAPAKSLVTSRSALPLATAKRNSWLRRPLTRLAVSSFSADSIGLSTWLSTALGVISLICLSPIAG